MAVQPYSLESKVRGTTSPAGQGRDSLVREQVLGLRVIYVANYLQETRDPRFGGLEWLFQYFRETARENPIKTAFERVFEYIQKHHPELYRLANQVRVDVAEAVSDLEYYAKRGIENYKSWLLSDDE